MNYYVSLLNRISKICKYFFLIIAYLPLERDVQYAPFFSLQLVKVIIDFSLGFTDPHPAI